MSNYKQFIRPQFRRHWWLHSDANTADTIHTFNGGHVRCHNGFNLARSIGDTRNNQKISCHTLLTYAAACKWHHIRHTSAVAAGTQNLPNGKGLFHCHAWVSGHFTLLFTSFHTSHIFSSLLCVHADVGEVGRERHAIKDRSMKTSWRTRSSHHTSHAQF